MASTTSLVSIQDVNSYIALMRCIHKLQQSLQLGGISQGKPEPPTPNTLNFLRHAVMRFSVWLSIRQDSQVGLSEVVQIPPLDVLMVWHAYMLLPVVYWMDSQQSLPILASLGGIPWRNLASLISLINFGVLINIIHPARVYQARQSRVYRNIGSASLGKIDLSSIHPRYRSRTS